MLIFGTFEDAWAFDEQSVQIVLRVREVEPFNDIVKRLICPVDIPRYRGIAPVDILEFYTAQPSG
jgi:hypothetical protein